MHQIHPSAASEFIRVATEEHGKKKWLADLLGVRLEIVGRWSRGERKPATAMRARLQTELGLDWTLWDAPPTQCPSVADVLDLIAGAQTKKQEAPAEPTSTFPPAGSSAVEDTDAA